MLKNAICSRLTAALMPATSTPPSTPTTSAISTSEVSRALTKARQRGGASTKNVVVVIPASLKHDPEKWIPVFRKASPRLDPGDHAPSKWNEACVCAAGRQNKERRRSSNQLSHQ